MRKCIAPSHPFYLKTSSLAALAVLISACTLTPVKSKDVVWTGEGKKVALGALCAPEQAASSQKMSAHRLNANAVCYLNLLASREDTPAKEEKALLQVARGWLQQARTKNPHSPFGDTAKAFSYLVESQSQGTDIRKKTLAKAIAALRSALRTQPRSASAHRLLGRALALSGQYRAAEREFRLLIESGLGDAGTYAWLGYVFEKQGQKVDAASLWKKASEIGAPSLEAAWADKMVKCTQPSGSSC